MEITLFWVLLAIGLVPSILGILAVLADEYVAQHGGWHKRHA